MNSEFYVRRNRLGRGQKAVWAFSSWAMERLGYQICVLFGFHFLINIYIGWRMVWIALIDVTGGRISW